MTEWNSQCSDFDEFTKLFDDFAELSPWPKSDEGGGGIAKQMCHRKFTTEGSKAVVEHFKGKGSTSEATIAFRELQQQAAEKSQRPSQDAEMLPSATGTCPAAGSQEVDRSATCKRSADFFESLTGVSLPI